MKKIFFFLFSLFLLFSCFQVSSISADSSLISTDEKRIIVGEAPAAPSYCQGTTCSFDSGIKVAAGKIKDLKKPPRDKSIADYIQDVVAEILTYLILISVIVIIYAGFMILTAGGDEEKVTKGKKIILYVVIGIIVIYLAGPLTKFIIRIFE